MAVARQGFGRCHSTPQCGTARRFLGLLPTSSTPLMEVWFASHCSAASALARPLATVSGAYSCAARQCRVQGRAAQRPSALRGPTPTQSDSQHAPAGHSCTQHAPLVHVIFPLTWPVLFVVVRQGEPQRPVHLHRPVAHHCVLPHGSHGVAPNRPHQEAGCAGLCR